MRTKIAAALVMLMFATPAAAASIFAFVGDALLNPGGTGDSASAGPGGSVSISHTHTVGDNTLTSSAQAIATFGALGVETFADFVLSTPMQHASAFGISVFNEEMTISFAPFNGATGLLYVFYTLDGSFTNTAAGTSVTQVAVLVQSAGLSGPAQISNQAYTSSVSGTFAAQNPFAFTFGQPMTLHFCLGAASGSMIVPAVGPTDGHITNALCSPGVGASSTGSGTGHASFFNTLVVSGIAVVDANGNPVPDASITTGSGLTYPQQAPPVPEPSSVLMIGVAAAALLAHSRTR